jgi:hypothetical protein
VLRPVTATGASRRCATASGRPGNLQRLLEVLVRSGRGLSVAPAVGQDEGMSEPVPELRVGDRERGETDALLRDALADGVLSLTEYEERAGQCWAARTRR